MAFVSQTSLPTDDRVLLSNVVCSADIVAGDWVRFNDSNILVKAKADLFDNSDVVGLVEEKNGSTSANILVAGISKPIFTGLNLTKSYFLSVEAEGGMYQPPVLDNSNSVVLCLGRPATVNQFIVRIQQRMVRS